MRDKQTSGNKRRRPQGKVKGLQKQQGGNEANKRDPEMKEKTLPVHKDERVVADIIGLGQNGEGVGRVNGFTLFVDGALPGEKVLAQVVKLKKNYGYAKLLEMMDSSSQRIKPPCAIYPQCGGCQLQHLNYNAQLEYKRQMVVDSLQRIGKLQVREVASDDASSSIGTRTTGTGLSIQETDGGNDGIIVHPTLGMDDPWRYRNKAQVPIGEQGSRLVGGFYAQGSHRIIDMETCLIQDERNDIAVREVKAIAQKLGVTAYNEVTHQGLLRHVVVKSGFRTGDIMVVLVTNSEQLPRANEWIEHVLDRIPGVTSICHNVNTHNTNVIFGDRTNVLWGNDVIYDFIGDVQFAISARSFYQVNPLQTEVLYKKAMDYAELTGKETVIDAYCGIGTISLFLAQQAKQVYGVEIVSEAIEDARNNAILNGIRNVEFAVGKAEEVIPKWKQQGIIPDVIVVDPPRKGCERSLLETFIEMQPKRIVYVSCDPATLARDLRILEDGGYRTVEVQPVDMFPHTTHVECCVSLVRK